MQRSAGPIVSGVVVWHIAGALTWWASHMNQPTTGILGYSSKPWGGWGFLVFVGAIGLIIGTGMFLNGLWNLLNNLDEVHKRQLAD